MNLKSFDDNCVRIITDSGETYEGTASYLGEEYVFHEYGQCQEALLLNPILFYKDDIVRVISLEDVNGPFGHFSEKFGLLEKKCLEWGTDLIEEVFDSDDDIQILRMLACMNDHFQALKERVVRGMAPWRSAGSTVQAQDEEDEQGPIYLGELEKMLGSLVKYNGNDEVVKEAKAFLERIEEAFPDGCR